MKTGRPVHWDWDAVRSVALTSGLSLAEVARQFGIPYNSVKSKARREGWAVNQVFGKVYPTQKERLPQTIKAMKKTVSELVAENGAASRIHLSQAIRKGAEHLGELEGPEVVEKHVAVNSLAKSAATVHGWDEAGQEERMSIHLFTLSLTLEQMERLAAGRESGELKDCASAEECRRYLGAGEKR